MKALKTLTIFTLAACMCTGGILAEEKKAEPPKYTEGSCCDKAQKEGKKCDHPCCVGAEKDGKVCKKCNK
ncbi:MAG: hypothetical protein HZC54_06060 [Verrucomicrobia bacterium]|nr:hypothetical protein [Verrucomicrobiota bacterium]